MPSKRLGNRKSIDGAHSARRRTRSRPGWHAERVSIPVLASRFAEREDAPSVQVFCPGYESGSWREEAFVQDVFDRHLTSFALTYSELKQVDFEIAAPALRKAAKSVYATDKYKKRGEFGELLLHAVLRDFYGAEPAIAKIYYKTAANETVKGFDGVHIVPSGDDIELWLGEAKFYKDAAAAVREALASLREHVQADFLRQEFVAITNHLDKDWTHADAVRTALAPGRSLDEVVTSLVVPVCLTYDSAAVSANDSHLTTAYIDAVTAEALDARARFAAGIDFALDVRVVLVLLPLKSKDSLVGLMHAKLLAWQAI